MTTAVLDQTRAEAFAERVTEVVNHGMLTLMMSVGHQVGLFDAMAGRPARTAEEVARDAGLDERYVREWLAAVTVGGLVEYDAPTRTYTLPDEHARFLTRAAGAENLARFAQFVPLLAGVEQDIVRCFLEGGGVPYSAYPRFQRLMAEETAEVQDALLLDGVLPVVPGLRERLEAGIDVLDVGCGSGHAMNLLAAAFPRSRFAGYDFLEESVGAARQEAAERGLGNVRFEPVDVATLDEPGRYDLITAFDAIHDQAHPDRVLAGVASALRPGGVFLMVDMAASSDLAENLDHPLAPALYTISCLHCMTVSLAQGGMGLGAMWGEARAREMLAAAGFRSVEVTRLNGDAFNAYYICRRG